MQTALLVAAVLIIQEFATSAYVFIMALQQNFPIWGIHLIWITTTLLDMYVGYAVGTFTKRRIRGTKLSDWIGRFIAGIKSSLGTHGEKFSLALLGIVDFPYVNAFLGAWIGLPLRTSILLTLAGNFIWYLVLWGTVLGLHAFVSDPDIILLILIGAGILSHFLFKLFRTNKG
jgi:hypothetical protein